MKRRRLALSSGVVLAGVRSGPRRRRRRRSAREAPGVRRGPLHRPGQPCLLCHDGALGDPQRFTVAGTVFQTPGAGCRLGGATVSSP